MIGVRSWRENVMFNVFSFRVQVLKVGKQRTRQPENENPNLSGQFKNEPLALNF